MVSHELRPHAVRKLISLHLILLGHVRPIRNLHRFLSADPDAGYPTVWGPRVDIQERTLEEERTQGLQMLSTFSSAR